MNTFQEKRKQISDAHDRFKAAEDRLHNIRSRVNTRVAELTATTRLGTAETERASKLKQEIKKLKTQLTKDSKLLADAKAGLASMIVEFAELADLSEQIEEWDDRFPILLLPVRVETRFMQVDTSTELWIRIFPDDVAIHTHESDLTLEEIEDGRDYWREISLAAGEADEKVRQKKEKGAWRTLTGDHGGSRASWVAVQTRSIISEDEEKSGIVYWEEIEAAEGEPDADVSEQRIQGVWLILLNTYGPIRARWIAGRTASAPDTVEITEEGNTFWQSMAAISADVDPSVRLLAQTDAWRMLQEKYGDFRSARIILETKPETWTQVETDTLVFRLLGQETAAPESWSRAPRSNVMPDRFAVLLQSKGKTITHFGAAIPDPLVLGPDPTAQDSDLQQKGGEIVPSEDILWMYDFNKAIEIGLGLKIPLDPPFDTTGFDRLIVVGLRISADEENSLKLIEELLENHHHAPDGAGIVPQGTPTNNTEESGSGFISRDPDPEHSLAVETGSGLFELTTTPAEKRDGQRLAEALGISFRSLEHFEYSNQADAAEAMAINQALWPATLGSYLEQMLGIEAATVRRVETFFVEHVSGRGPLPALRIGEQPYGLLVTSSFPAWKFESLDVTHVNTNAVPINNQIYNLLARLVQIWHSRLSQVSYAGKAGDAYQHLLNMLGLHATSVDFHRRHAVGSEFLYNYAKLVGDEWIAENTWRLHRIFVGEVISELGWAGKEPSPILDLTYFTGQERIVDPLVDDVENADGEIFSEEQTVKDLYKMTEIEDLQNYINWLYKSDLSDVRRQKFKNTDGKSVAPPRPLLYRMLRHGLLMANADAALQLYVDNDAFTKTARMQGELINVREQRTITQWEYLNAQINQVLPEVSNKMIPMHAFINSKQGMALPQTSGLSRVRNALAFLQDLPTARLERLFAEHVDLCTYRLDAWQTALFAERLWNLRRLPNSGDPDKRVTGLFLGAFGWLEDVRPTSDPATEVDPATVPTDLLEKEKGPLTEQPGNGGFIHGCSLNHAVAGAVLRNAYITHADSSEQDLMAVDLSSERIRIANSLLEGIRSGQPLGALLGYRFERGLKERYGDLSLAAYFPTFRNAYPLITDQITPDEDSEDTDLKEARNVFDGYRLLEVTLLSDTPLAYPYNVEGLPSSGSQANAIMAEVQRMAWALDAVKDVALAEGIYQVTQGNYDRGGAMLKAITQGTHPPEPEIVQTPRSGVAVNHRVALHFDASAVDHVWNGNATARSEAEPALNAWLKSTLGLPAEIRYSVQYQDPSTESGIKTDHENSLAELAIEPIDLIYIIGEELSNGQSELVRRIRNAFREKHPELTSDQLKELCVQFTPSHNEWTSAGHRSLFEIMPLISALKQLVKSTRPLAADDYVLPSEGTADLDPDANPKGYNTGEYKLRLDSAYDSLNDLFESQLTPKLNAVTNTVIDAADGEDGYASEATQNIRYTELRAAVLAFAPYGFPDAYVELTPIPPRGQDPDDPFELAWNQLKDLASSIKRQANLRLSETKVLKDLTNEQEEELTITQKIDRYREAARQVLGPDFNLLPRFSTRNPDELLAAKTFRDLPPDQGLFRHSDNSLITEEWFRGIAHVRDKLGLLETIFTLSDAFKSPLNPIKPLQLPYREWDYWMAVEYPEVSSADLLKEEVFRPVGDFLSIAQQLPDTGFDPSKSQTGLIVDAWTEVIPNRSETTGIAVNYNQPSTEPPQVMLLAVTPELTGKWKWEDLVSILEDTLERAKLRAIEPDHLGDSILGHFVPAILTPTTSNPNAAIAASLDYMTAINFATLSINDG